MGLFSKTTTYDPMSAYTPQQRQAIEMLQSLAATGSGGGITLGQQYTGDLGAYDTSGQQTAYDQILGLIGGQDVNTARNVYNELANTKFNPDDPSSGYAAFSRALAKAGQESSDVLNREAAITGSRFGTGIQKQKAELAEDLANQRGSYLSQLYQQGQQNKLQGASGLQNLASQQGQLAQAASQQAAIINEINNQKALDALSEFKRTRNEELSRIGLAQQQWENPMGVITTKGPSTFGSILGEISPIVGSYNTHKYGYTTGQTSINDAVSALIKTISGGA